MPDEYLKRGVENPAIIDLITTDKASGEAVLVMIEERPWTLGEAQLEQLDAKLNAYFAYVLDGHFAEQYPEYLGEPVRFQLDTLHEPSPAARGMLRMATQIAHQHGLDFLVREVAQGEIGRAPWELEPPAPKRRSLLPIVDSSLPVAATGWTYRSEVLAQLERFGVRPRTTTPPEKLRDFLDALYLFEIRELRSRRRELETVLGSQPLEPYRAQLHALKVRYTLLSLPLEGWTKTLPG
ncbi:MAG: hypothetical protein HC897_12050 [Thermoanaerobaculia bacterium]|nr:hypothetical protein [Thermoanaerobaculia bacterium]